jgi:hypothetical protein
MSFQSPISGTLGIRAKTIETCNSFETLKGFHGLLSSAIGKMRRDENVGPCTLLLKQKMSREMALHQSLISEIRSETRFMHLVEKRLLELRVESLVEKMEKHVAFRVSEAKEAKGRKLATLLVTLKEKGEEAKYWRSVARRLQSTSEMEKDYERLDEIRNLS